MARIDCIPKLEYSEEEFNSDVVSADVNHPCNLRIRSTVSEDIRRNRGRPMKNWLLLAFAIASPVVAEEEAPKDCVDLDYYTLLDFWLGDWVVYAGDERVGTNHSEKVLGGCAVIEHWTGAGGGEGKSLFYVVASQWKQVWVTEWATRTGGVKEKFHQPLAGTNAVRFQGRIETSDGSGYLDRTTLTPLGDGSVRQLIEISRDEGEHWESVFDAVYRKSID